MATLRCCCRPLLLLRRTEMPRPQVPPTTTAATAVAAAAVGVDGINAGDAAVAARGIVGVDGTVGDAVRAAAVPPGGAAAADDSKNGDAAASAAATAGCRRCRRLVPGPWSRSLWSPLPSDRSRPFLQPATFYDLLHVWRKRVGETRHYTILIIV